MNAFRAMAMSALTGLLLAVALPATAESDRFVPVLADPPARLPDSPGHAATAAPPQALVGASPTDLDYSVNADIDRIVVEVAGDHRPADGQTPTPVRVWAYDAEGRPVTGTRYATVEVSGGRLRLPGAGTDELGPGRLDLDRATPGTQLVLTDGEAEFELLAPAEPQDVLLRVTAGGQSAEGVIAFLPDVREMIAVGLIEGIVNFRDKRPGLISPARRGDSFEQEIRRWERSFNSGKANAAARAAFFLKGRIKGDALLTAAYDSDKETRGRLLRDIRPEEFYPVYGDASIRGFDARSAERLYVRIDKGRDYLLYGDFQTGDAVSALSGHTGEGAPRARSLGSYNRTATGLYLHKETERARGNVFAFRDSLRQVVEEFQSQGSGPYGLRNNAVLEGSERVEVIVRDRDQPSRILAVQPLLRFADYVFEPFSGRIVLTRFLHAFDAELNPQSLRVSYEVDQGGGQFWVYGGDGELRLLPWLDIGGSYVKDENPFAGFELASANASIRLGPRTALVGEWARSEGEINTNPINRTFGALEQRSGSIAGNAWRLEFDHRGEVFDARLYAGRSDPEFNNPSSPLYGGRAEYSADLGLQASERVRLYAEALRSEDRSEEGGHRTAVGAGARIQASERLSLNVGARALDETTGRLNSFLGTPFSDRNGLLGSVATGAAGGALGFGQQAIDPISGLPAINNGLAGGTGSGLPVGTRLNSETIHLGLAYRVSDRLDLAAEAETDVGGRDRERYALGADWRLRERQRVYARYETQTGLIGPLAIADGDNRADAFVFGTEQTYLRDTQVYGEYRLRDAIGGRDIQAASGVRTGWDIDEGLRLTAGAEHVNVITGRSGDATGVFFGIDYTANPLWRGSTRIELRRSGDVDDTPDDERFDTALWQVTVARKLDRDWTLLGRNYLLLTDYAARGDVLQNRSQIGLAYRDNDRNRVNALARYEYKLENDRSGLALGGLPPAPVTSPTGGDFRVRAHIVSAHSDWHPSRPWWLTGRIAGKLQRDRFARPGSDDSLDDSFRALLLSGRVVYDITEKWDIGVLGSLFGDDDGARQYAYGLELGRLLSENLWLSLGYNWAGFEGDADLTGYEYTQRGVFIRLRFKFDETLFKSDPHGSADR